MPSYPSRIGTRSFLIPTREGITALNNSIISLYTLHTTVELAGKLVRLPPSGSVPEGAPENRGEEGGLVFPNSG